MKYQEELKFVLSAASLYVTFLLWGIEQEKITSTVCGNNERWHFSIILNLCMCVTASIVGFLIFIVWPSQQDGENWRTMCWKFRRAAFTCAIGSPIGYASLKYISFPTLILAKACKLVPIMFIGRFIFNKRYLYFEYISVFFITIGIAMFTYKNGDNPNSKESPNPLLGLSLVFVNLILDGFTNSEQDNIYASNPHIKPRHMMLWMNIWQALIYLTWLGVMELSFMPNNIFSLELSSFLDYYTSCSSSILTHISLFSLTGSLGQVSIFFNIHAFGSLVNVTLTVTRKLFSMVLSVIIFHHVFSILQWVGSGLVFVGLTISLVGKYTHDGGKKKKDKDS